MKTIIKRVEYFLNCVILSLLFLMLGYVHGVVIPSGEQSMDMLMQKIAIGVTTIAVLIFAIGVIAQISAFFIKGEKRATRLLDNFNLIILVIAIFGIGQYGYHFYYF